MPERRAQPRGDRARTAAAVVLGIFLLAALVGLVPYLLHKAKTLTSAATPRALLEGGGIDVPAHYAACMSSVTITSDSRIAHFRIAEAGEATSAGTQLELSITAPGYKVSRRLPSEASGETDVRITPPPRTVIGSVCLTNLGKTAARFIGSREPRGSGRSQLTLNGKPAAGDIGLTFLDTRQRSRLARLGEVFGHASNLTDRLVPAWFIWLLAVGGIVAVPIAILAALRRALREDDLSARP